MALQKGLRLLERDEAALNALEGRRVPFHDLLQELRSSAVCAPQHALANALPVSIGAHEHDAVLPAHHEWAVLLALLVAAPVDGAIRPRGLAWAMLQPVLPGSCIFDAVGPSLRPKAVWLSSIVHASLVRRRRHLARVEYGVGDAADVFGVRADNVLAVRLRREASSTEALSVAIDTSFVPCLLSLCIVCDWRLPRVIVDVEELRVKRLEALDEPRVV